MLEQQTSRTSRSARVIVVGGGVIGLSIARELARRGFRHILICDRGKLGKEASWAAGGILAPQVEADCADDFFKLASASRDLYPSFAQALHDETGIDIELDQTGTLYVAFSEDGEPELRERFEWQRRAALRVEWLNGADVRRLEPNVSNLVRCALRFPDDWQVENRKLVAALITANQKLGVESLADGEVTSLRVDRDRVVGVETSSGVIRAAIVVVCAGAWTSSLSIAGAVPIEIEPVRGQMLCFEPNVQLVRHVIYSSRGYLVPRRDGRLITGSTSEHVGFDKRVTPEGVKAIQSMAFEIAPTLYGEPLVASWAGFRPRSLDNLPVIGPDAEIEGLFYATGHFRNGILLAPITAEITAKCITERFKSPLLERFLPNRFGAVPPRIRSRASK